MRSDLSLHEIRTGSVEAPAGCGKTQLIADTIERHQNVKPILVLTHTNAGVDALRRRLMAKGVPPSLYRIHTIDGWSRRLVSAFPNRSGFERHLLEKENIFEELQKSALRLAKEGHVNDVIDATYDRLIVDEYQDCSVDQHALILAISSTLDTCILGDPMQAIFDFKAPLVSWNNAVLQAFPPVGKLATPWRWKNEGTEKLGRWLLEIRDDLAFGREIDLKTSCPREVKWIAKRTGVQDEISKAVDFAQEDSNSSFFVMVPSHDQNARDQYARRIFGAHYIEAVELKELTDLARKMDMKDKEVIKHIY